MLYSYGINRPYLLSRGPHLLASRCYTTSSTTLPGRAVVYAQKGNPTEVLRVKSYKLSQKPPADSLIIRFRLAPINPSDINLVQGVYPASPAHLELSGEEVFVGGNEGVADVIGVGEDVEELKQGDRVIMAKAQVGTWSTIRTVHPQDVIKLPSKGLSDVNAATISVNPPTAYNMLHEFVNLKEDDWVLQNGANSAVGQAVIQIAARKGIKTINFIRNRPDLDHLITSLTQLGATHVFTYDALQEESLTKKIKQWTSRRPIRLMLNCVGGKDTTSMVRLLGEGAHIVSYGAMSKQPLTFPTSAFIFKDLHTHGFWQNRWYTQHTRSQREELMQIVANLNLNEPEHQILDLSSEENNKTATVKLQEALKKTEHGFRRKILLRL